MKKISCLLFTAMLLIATFAAASLSIVESKSEHKDHQNYDSFVLQASGKAYDSKNHKWVDTTLSLYGEVEGKFSKTLTLHSKDGTLKVKGYGDSEVVVSNGIVILKMQFAHFMLLLCPQYYGGSKSVVFMWGKAKEAHDDTISICLEAEKIMLPFQNHPILKDLELKGTIELS